MSVQVLYRDQARLARDGQGESIAGEGAQRGEHHPHCVWYDPPMLQIWHEG